MNNDALNDERVINERRKIINDAFSLIMTILIASILIQQFVLKADFSAYATEFICFYGASIYILIKNISVGNTVIANYSDKKKSLIKCCLTTGVVMGILCGLQSLKESYNAGEIFLTGIGAFLIAIIASAITLTAISKLSKYKMSKIEKELDDDNE